MKIYSPLPHSSIYQTNVPSNSKFSRTFFTKEEAEKMKKITQEADERDAQRNWKVTEKYMIDQVSKRNSAIDKNYKSEYGYLYEISHNSGYDFEISEKNYHSIREKILREYQGEEQAKRLDSLEKDYLIEKETLLSILRSLIGSQLLFQEINYKSFHVDRRAHAMARGEEYDNTELYYQLKQLNDKRSQYNQIFSAVREMFGKKDPHSRDLLRSMMRSLNDCVEIEEKNTKNIAKTMNNGVSNEKVSELSQLTSTKNRLFLEYSDRIFLSDQEKYQAFLEYSKKVKPLNEKIEQLKKEIAQTEE